MDGGVLDIIQDGENEREMSSSFFFFFLTEYTVVHLMP